VRFQPGDRVLLEGGQTFKGFIWLQAAASGSAAKPIVFGSYGRGRATVSSGTGFGFYAFNTGCVEVRDLVFKGTDRLSNTAAGVIFYTDVPDSHLRHLVLHNLEVSGYRKAGISIGSWKGGSGYDDVRITNCRSYANGEAGLASYAEALAAHHNWYIARCRTFDNAGRADVPDRPTGSGIVLSGVDGAVVEHCRAYRNGWLNAHPEGGPVGIWGWRCNNLVIQHCVAHHNRSGTPHDGGGFDLDGGCTNSVLQHNLSYQNQGPGYLLAQYRDAPPFHHNVVRSNVSINDARRNGTGAIMLWSTGASGGIQHSAIYDNVVVIGPTKDKSATKALYVCSGGISSTVFRHNLLLTTGGVPKVVTEEAGRLAVDYLENCCGNLTPVLAAPQP
jgi:hypothetical protein